jgi:hypothetical protein
MGIIVYALPDTKQKPRKKKTGAYPVDELFRHLQLAFPNVRAVFYQIVLILSRVFILCYNAAVMIHANRGSALLFVVVSGFILTGVHRIAPVARKN